MKPAPFKYIAARTLDEALAVKAEHGEDARFLAGGQSLVPALNFRLAHAPVLIDINPLAELAGVRTGEGGVVRIGALTRYRALERDRIVTRDLPLVAEALPEIAHPQIRNRGTLGGNLANADPASEMPAIVLALGGRLRAQSVKGERWIDAADFFVGALTTALATDEMLIEVEFPVMPATTGVAFLEMARRRGDFALLGVAAIVCLDADTICRDARIGYCGAGDGPLLALDAAQSLIGRSIGPSDFVEAAALAQRAINPHGNVHATKDYQRHLAGVLTRRALQTATEQARHDQ
jgi:aerobic carbon-monoxide dehydrogenase medium subunit